MYSGCEIREIRKLFFAYHDNDPENNDQHSRTYPHNHVQVPDHQHGLI